MMSKRTRRFAAILVMLLFGLAGRCLLAEEQTYLVLLDVSGSMEKEGEIKFLRYSSGEVRKLMQDLTSAMNRAKVSPTVYVQPFSSSKQAYTEQGPMPPSDLKDHVPSTAHGAETELDDALQFGLRAHPNAALLILTDNKNDFSGSKSDRRFYELLAKDPRIHTVYFVPLAPPGSTRDALVLYAIGAGENKPAQLGLVIAEFAKAVGSDSVLFRGFYGGTAGASLSFSQNIWQTGADGEDRRAESEGDAVVLRFDEGRPLDGALKFRIHSNLRHWKIVDGELRKAEANLAVPNEYSGSGEYALPAAVLGSHKVNVLPGGDTAEIYSLPLSVIGDAGVRLQRASLFRTSLPDIPARVQLRAVVRVSERAEMSGLQPALTPALEDRIRAVYGLPEIMNLMTFQPDATTHPGVNERVIRFDREVLIRVKPDVVKNGLAHGVRIGVPLLMIAALITAVVLLRKQTFALLEPVGRVRIVQFGMLGGSQIVNWGGKKVATLQLFRNGQFQIRPEPGFLAEPMSLAKLPARFEMRNTRTQESGQYELRHGAAQARAVTKGAGK